MNEPAGKANVPLWLLGVPVVAWGLHFLVVYIVAAVYCAKAAALETAVGTPLTAVRWWTAGFTLATLLVYALTAKRGYRGWRGGGVSTERNTHDQGRFLGSVLLMLCILSAAATIFVACVPFFFEDCRQ